MKILTSFQPYSPNRAFYGFFILFSLVVLPALATNYTWTGSSSKDWSTSGNWSPSGVPGSGDNVTIGSGSDTVQISGNITIANLTMSGRKLNLAGYTLTSTGTSALSGGKVYNGKLLFSGSQVTFSSTADIASKVNITSPKPYFNGGTFADSVVVNTVLASSSTLSSGGTTFNGPLVVSVSGSTYTFRMEGSSRNIYNAPVSFTVAGRVTFQFSNTSGTNTVFSDTLKLLAKDTAYIQQNGASGLSTTFNKKVLINCQDTAQIILGLYSGQTTTFNDDLDISASSKRRVYIAHSGSVVFNDNVFLSCISGAGIYFGYNTTASLTHSSGALQVGTGGFSGGRLDLYRYSKTSSDSTALTFTGASKIIFGISNTFSGPVRVVSPMMYLNGTTFNSYVRLDQNGTTNTSSTGGNTFNGETVIGEYGTGQFQLCTSASATDNFNGKTIFKNYASYDFSDAGNLVISKDGTSNFSGSKTEIFLNTASRIIFGYNDGSVVNMNTNLELNSISDGWVYLGGRASKFNLGAGKTIKVGSSGFSGGRACFYNVEQVDTTSINLTFTGSGSRLSFIKQSYSPFGTTKLRGKLNYSGPVIDMEEGDFFGDVTISITSGANTNSYSSGGNDFYGNLSFENNSSYTARLAYLKADVYHKNVSLNKVGSGNIQAAYLGENIFKGNISTNGGVLFGTNGGWVKLDSSATQTIDFLSGGSGVPSFKKLKIDKTGGKVQVNLNGIVTDSLNLVNGVIKMGNSNYLDLKAGLICSGGSNTSYVEGLVKKTGNTSFVFPLGAEGYYRYLGISAPTLSTDAFTAEYFNTNANASYSFASAEAGLSDFDTTGYWMLSRTTGNSTPNVSLGWHTSGCGFINPNTLKVAQWNGSQWLNKGNNSYTSSSITANSINSFGPFVVSKLSALKVNAGNDTSFCAGSSVGLSTSLSNGTAPFTYTWSPATGLSSATVSNPTASPTATTTYTVSVTDARGCSASDEVVVTVNPLPVADAGSNASFCEGSSVGLSASASSGTPLYSYSWSPSTGLSSASVSNPTASPSSTTTYTVTVTDSKGCSANDGVVVTVNQLGDNCNCIIQADSLDSIGSKYTILLDSEITWFAITAIDSSFMLEIQTDDSALINNIEIFENCDGDSIPQEYYRRFTDNYLIIKDAIPAQTYFVKITVLNLIETKLAKISLKSAPANPSNTLSNGLFQISDCEWFRKSGTTGSDISSDIAIDPATGNSFGVYTYKFNGTNVWILIAYDPVGNILWFKYPQPCANLSLVNSSSAAVSFDIYNNRVVVAGDFTGTMNLGNDCLNSNLGSVFVASFAASSGTLSNSANYGVNFTPQILGNYSPEDAIMPYLVTSPCVFIDSDIYGNSFMAISTKNIDASFSFFVTPNLQLTPSIAALNSSNVDFYPDVAILKLNSNLSLVWQNSIGGQGLHDCNGISYNQTTEKIYAMGIFEKGLLPNGSDNFIDYSNSPFTNSNTRKISAYIAPFDARTASTTGDFNSLGFRRIAPYGINDEAGQTLGVFLADINSNNDKTIVVGKTIHDSQSLQKYQAYDISGATITPSNLGGAIPWYENFVYSITDDQCIKIEHNLTSNSGFLPSGIAINANDEVFVNGYLSGSVDIGTPSGTSFILNPHNQTYGSPTIIKKNLSGATLGSVTFGAYGTFITPIRSKIEVDDCSTFSVGNLEYTNDVFQNNYTAAATDHYTLKYNDQLVNTDTQYVCLTSGNITLTSPLIGNSYSWNPGGATSSSISVSSSGIYTLSVTTTCCTYQIVFIVVQGPPTGTINANQNCSTGQFSFNFAGNNYPNSYSWDFGDPSTTTDVSTLPNPTYTYPTTGVYDVTLIVANACTSATFQLQVYVLDACCFQSNRFVFSNISASNLNTLFPTLLSATTPITITSKNIYIDGQFTVDQPIIFNSCDILMGENAQIILTSAGSVLDMELNGTQVKGCDKMWDFMEANNSNEQIKINGTSIIEDGKQAVKCINGGKFDINGAYFNKNYISIFIDNGGSNPGSVINSGFFCHQSLLNPTDVFLLPPNQTTESKSHIEISNTTSITIGNTTSHNIFNNATFGIFADNVSSLSVIHNKFYDMNAGYNQTGPIGGGQLVYTGNGICAVGSGSNDFLNVSNSNEFYNCDLGVKIQNGVFLNVNENYFENCKLYGVGFGFNFGNFNVDIINNTFGAKDEQPVGWAVGGWLSSGNTININGNAIDFSDAAENTGRGIVLSESGFNMNYPGSNFNIISNKMNSVVTGIQLLGQNGINSPLVNENPAIGSLDWELNAATDLVKDNNILLRSTTSLLSNLYNDGIVAKNCTGIAITCNEVSCDGGLSCNDWKWWSQGVSHDGGGASVIKTNNVSNLAIGLGFGQDLRPTELVLDNKMFNLGRTGMFFGWGAIGNQGSLLSSSPTTTGYSYGNKWLGTNWSGSGPYHSEVYGNGTDGNLSKFFVDNSSSSIPLYNQTTGGASYPMQYQILDNTIFYTTCAIPDLEFLEGYEPKNPGNIVLQNCLMVVTDTSTATDDISETNRFWGRFNTYSFLKADTNGLLAMDSLLIVFMAENDTTDIGKLYKVQNTIRKGKNLKQSELDSVANMNSTVAGAVLATANLKSINELLLAKPESMEFDSAEQDYIRELAALCPFTNGPAVYIARGLAKGIDSTLAEYINECELAPEPVLERRAEWVQNTQGGDKDNFRMHPNPASEQLILDYAFMDDESGMLKLFNAMGQPVYTSTLLNGQNKLTINVTNMVTGIYVAIIYHNKTVKKQFKISIVK